MAKNRRLVSANDVAYIQRQSQAKVEQYGTVSAADVMPSLQGAANSMHSARIVASETKIKSKKWVSPLHQADEQLNEFGQYLIPYFENLSPDWLPALSSPYYDERERAQAFAQDRYQLRELYRVIQELAERYAALRAELHEAAIVYADKLVEEYRLQQIGPRRKLVEEAWVPIVSPEDEKTPDAQTDEEADAVADATATEVLSAESDSEQTDTVAG